MARYQRVIGGERNERYGKRWSEEELRHVLELYLALQEKAKDNQPKIHEHNKDIQILGERLGRVTRSVESQMLMFRCLDRHKIYSRKNMSKLSIKLWNEHIKTLIKE